jgi:hypothetical protein
MVKWFFIAAVLWGGVGIIFLVWGFRGFDSALRHLYSENHEKWVHLGKPCGFFWVPPEARQQLTSSSLVRAKLFWSCKRSDLSGVDLADQGNAPFDVPILLARISFIGALLALSLCVVSVFF